MRFRTMLAIIVSLLIAALVILNWRPFAAPMTLNFLVTSADLPIGIVMLAILMLGLIVVSSLLGMWHGTLLAEFRRQSKELQAQRELAENAEASRFTELGSLVRNEIANSDKRIETAIAALRQELEETENSIAATLGEIDDGYRREMERPG